jgi:phosphoribosylglycinamide formyltransferase 1
MRQNARKRTAVLISGRGSNLASLIDAAAEPGYPAEIALVISDQPDARGLGIAIARGVQTRVLERSGFPDRLAHEAAIEAALEEAKAELVCLAGYMRLLSPEFAARWGGRIINIHPSLLPLFRELDTHRKALEAGMRVHGCTVHFVTPEVDAGPIIAQAAVPVLQDDTEESLAARVLKAEHQLYPLALRLAAKGQARLESGRVVLAGETSRPGMILISPSEPRDESADLEQLARFTP